MNELKSWCGNSEDHEARQDTNALKEHTEIQYEFQNGGDDKKWVSDVPHAWIGYNVGMAPVLHGRLVTQDLGKTLFKVYHYLFAYNTDFRQHVLGVIRGADGMPKVPMIKPSRKRYLFSTDMYPRLVFGTSTVFLASKPSTANGHPQNVKWNRWRYSALLLNLDRTIRKNSSKVTKEFFAADKYDRPIGALLVRLGNCMKTPTMMAGVDYIRRRNKHTRDYTGYEDAHKRRRDIPNPSGYKHTGYRVRHCDSLVATFIDPRQSDDDRFSLAWWTARRAHLRKQCANVGRGPGKFKHGNIPLPPGKNVFDPMPERTQSYREPSDPPPTQAPGVPRSQAPVVSPTQAPVVSPTQAPSPAQVQWINAYDWMFNTNQVPGAPPTQVPVVSPTQVPVVSPTQVPGVSPTQVPGVSPTQALSPARVSRKNAYDLLFDAYQVPGVPRTQISLPNGHVSLGPNQRRHLSDLLRSNLQNIEFRR